jgi:cob(I)alamin adenosyltransferase
LAALRFMFRATFDKLLATSKDTNAKVSNGGNSKSIGDIAPRLEDKVERTNEKIERTEGKVDQLALVVASFKSEAVTAAPENRLAAASAERHAQAAATAAKDAAQAAAQAATGVARIEAHLGAQDTTIGLLAAALKTD